MGRRMKKCLTFFLILLFFLSGCSNQSERKEQSDIRAYREFLELNYGDKTIQTGQMLDTLLTDIDHDGKKEIIVFEYCGEPPIIDSQPNRYNWTIYKCIDKKINAVYQGICEMQVPWGQHGEGIKLLKLDDKDYLCFWSSYRITSQHLSVEYLKNNKMVNKSKIEIYTKYDMYDKNGRSVESQKNYGVNDKYFTASINGQSCSVADAQRLLEKYETMAFEVNGLTEMGDYLGCKWINSI